MISIKKYLACLQDPDYAIPAIKVALLVGTILFCINHAVALINDQMTMGRWLSALLTYIVPYMVNIHGRWSSLRKTQA